MIQPWRLLALAVAFEVTLGVAAATAQTVIVRDAPKGSTVESQFNASGTMSAPADANGDATIVLTLPPGMQETTTRVTIDTCPGAVRVLLIEPSFPPPAPGAGCSRREVPTTFITRRVSTFVVDLAGSEPAVHLRQGAAPAEWLLRGAAANRGPFITGKPRSGLVLGGGIGRSSFTRLGNVACGNVGSCSENTSEWTLTGGATFWVMPWIGARVDVIDPGGVSANGSGTGFRFTSDLDADFVTIAGTGGVPAGPARIYGLGGLNHHRAVFTVAQTNDDTTVEVDGVTQTIKGGTQTLVTKTEGWGLTFGAGIEVWLKPFLAVFAEGSALQVKGEPVGGGEGAIDDKMYSLRVGARIRIGR